MKQYKNKIISGAVIVAVLAFVFWYGGNSPSIRGWFPQTEKTDMAVETDEQLKAISDESEKKVSAEEQPPEEQLTGEQTSSIQEEPYSDETNKSENPGEPEAVTEDTVKDKYMTDPVPEGKPVPVEPENTVITEKELTCTLSVRCDTVLQNLQWLDSEKVELVPKDGVIFAERTVVFHDGESVFDLLLREMKGNKIHMEFVNTPIYNSAYIEGIANLYEFDLGELSGWMYKVNGWFPNYGCSRYRLKAGDKVEWVYTCDLGADVGGSYSTRNGN